MAEPGLPFSAAAERNRAPILDVLTRWLPPSATVLEVASGTGQHAAHCAAARSGWSWQPTEAEPAALQAIAARCAGLANVLPPRALDVTLGPWPAPTTGGQAGERTEERAGDGTGRAATGSPGLGWDVVFCANLVHIAPWPVAVALLQGAARVLAPGGQLVLYGPYRVDGERLPPGNQAFDADLRERHAEWGLRHLGAMQAAAAEAGLALDARADMPANNLMLRWRNKAPIRA